MAGGLEKEAQRKDKICGVPSGHRKRNGEGSTNLKKWRNKENS